MFNTYFHGLWMLAEFYIFSVKKIHALPKWIRNPNTLAKIVDEKEEVLLSVETEAEESYLRGSKMIEENMRTLHCEKVGLLSFQTTLRVLVFLRILVLVLLLKNHLTLAILTITMQAVVAPYSILVALAQAIALILPLYSAHYASFLVMKNVLAIIAHNTPDFIMEKLCWSLPFLHIQFTPFFIAAYFFLDTILCFYCHFFHSQNNFSLQKTVKHIVWGFINAKSYTLIIFLSALNAGSSIPTLVWFLDAYFNVTGRVANAFTEIFFHWQELHYTFHSMAHLPVVYTQAHKFHHLLHMSSAFDAHSIFGNGMPEEFFFLIFELSCSYLLGLPPAHTNYFLLKMIFQNKFAHSEISNDFAGENFHARHHSLHNKNFGHNCLLDMLFSTCESNSCYRMTIGKNVYSVVKTNEDSETRFLFTKIF